MTRILHSVVAMSLRHRQFLEGAVRREFSRTAQTVDLYAPEQLERSAAAQLLAPVEQELVLVRLNLGLLLDGYHALPAAPLAPMLVDYDLPTRYQDGATGDALLRLCDHFGLSGIWRTLVTRDPGCLPLLFHRNGSAPFITALLTRLIPGAAIQVFDAETPYWRADVPHQARQSGGVHVSIDVDGPHHWLIRESELRELLARLCAQPSKLTYRVTRCS